MASHHLGLFRILVGYPKWAQHHVGAKQAKYLFHCSVKILLTFEQIHWLLYVPEQASSKDNNTWCLVMTAKTTVLIHISTEQSQANHELVPLIKGHQERAAAFLGTFRRSCGYFWQLTMWWPANIFRRWADDHILVPRSFKKFTLLKRSTVFLRSLPGSSISEQGELRQSVQ